MLFNSTTFIFIFLPITFALYFIFAKYKFLTMAKLTLILASLFFYAYWDYRYLGLLLLSVFFNFGFAKLLIRYSSKALLTIGVGCNLLLLGYFKYADFFILNLNSILGNNIGALNIILPLGISFFTFQQIAYLVDTYREPVNNYGFLNYLLFVSFFPQLIAGPIVDHKKMMPQINNLINYSINYQNISLGLLIFLIGLFKKVVVADTLSGWATPGFDVAESLTFVEAWSTALSYTFQLYFDFSGYAEMAIGLGLLFNFKLPVNFLSPYKASNIIDFWKGWHITLSNFLKTYLYIPLGGNRKGSLRRYLNLFLTMLLGGLWHGAGWTFVIWGGLHGAYLVINHSFRRLKEVFYGTLKHEEVRAEVAATGSRINSFSTFSNILSRTITFLAVVVAWVFFRATSFGDAFKVLQGMVNFNDITFAKTIYLPMGSWGILFLLGLLSWVNLAPNTMELVKRFRPNTLWLIFMIALAFFSIMNMNQISEFLYFQF